MTVRLKTDRLYVALGASQVRRRLKGHGFGVRKVETTGNNRAVIIHTATGKHLRQLEAVFHGVIEAKTDTDDGGTADRRSTARRILKVVTA
jgi:DNA transformation protein and related proteins